MAAHIGGNVARLWRHYAEQNERSIPQHRELPLSSHHEMHVGDCVPFFFCPRPVMLFVIHKKNDPDLLYRGGQDLIVDTLIKAAAHNSAIPAQAGISDSGRGEPSGSAMCAFRALF
ncbi:MAG: DarT ssDNA thymidine ADP-ribosyltransferase family protein, partial [Gammaproteobacteria bacterium]|nr:DarT ssDNA thymidine ADP-ribosyltransferase family protein [Gammaproteobacteria bacterium]